MRPANNIFVLILALAAATAACRAQAFRLLEVPSLEPRVAAAELAPVAERLPGRPLIVDLAAPREPGRHGGELRLLMGASKDVRMMTVYGYARLVGYDERLQLRPDILERVEVKEGREFTLHLRDGHRWSDGHPFTAEDFRYFWQDVANNEALSPFGPPRVLEVDGELPAVEFPDATTVRYRWSSPNPYFLPALAAARPLYVYRPAHYLKQFHAEHSDPAELERKAAALGARNWAGLHHRFDKLYRYDNPDLPVLQPWVNTTAMPSYRFEFVRNPYYHRIDSRGRQLPYIDRVIVNVSSASLVPIKTGVGESDLQARYLRLDNFTFLKAGEKHNDFTARLWHIPGSQIALFPNQNTTDPVWRELVRDVRFRRALSLAIDRHEINQVVYFGLLVEGNNTVLPESPLFRPEYQTLWAEFDLDQANRLLDEIGLTRRDKRGVRLMPDGRPLEIVIQTSGESTEETDVLELVQYSWLKAGIKLYTKPSQREVFRNRVFSGKAMMSVWKGIENGVANADMSPAEFAPTSQNQLQWPQWGQHLETRGNAGSPPDLPAAARLLELNRTWRRARTHEERERVWHEMLRTNAQQVFSIGIVARALQPVVVNNHLRNVPEEGIYSWMPGSYFGIYRPDTFWFDDPRRPPDAEGRGAPGQPN